MYCPPDKQYPTIENAIFDPQTIQIIKDLASSRNSEFSAVNAYVFQEQVFAPFYPNIADELEKIGVQEMVHMELLMQAIVDFGGTPTYTSGRGEFWSARFLNYTKNIRQALNNDIREEEMTIADYTRSATLVSNKSLADLFLAIAQDEMEHKRILEGLLVGLDV